MLDKFLSDESTGMRLARTVVQGLLSVLIVAVPVIVAGLDLDATAASLVTAAIMCVLSPLMALMRTGDPEGGLVDATRGADESGENDEGRG